MPRNPRNSHHPSKLDVRNSEFSTEAHRPDPATTQQFRSLKQKPMFSPGLRKCWTSKSKLHGPRLHDPGAGDQAPWVQDPQTQCLRPRLQANKSKIYCACFSFNKSTLCAPYMLTAEPFETSGSSRGCALPRLPALGARNTSRSPCSCLTISAFFIS